MKTQRLLIVTIASLVLGSTAIAQAAQYWIWKSKLDGKTTCQQIMQGEWTKIAGPFRDSQCKKPA